MRWVLAVFLGACTYGFVPTVTKSAYAAGFAPIALVGSQLLFAAIILWVLASFFSKGHPTKKETLQLLGAGTCTGMSSLFFNSSLQYLDASVAVVLLFQFTWIGLLVEAAIQRQWPSWRQWTAIAILGIGTVFASGAMGNTKEFVPVGVVWGLLSGLAYALILIFSGRVAPSVPSWTRAALMVTGGALLISLIKPLTYLVDGSLIRGLWVWAGANALVSSVIPMSLFSFGIPKIKPGAATLLGAAELPSTVFISWLLLNEFVSFIQWLGVVIILFGIAFPELMRKWKPRQRTSQTAS